MKKKKPIVLGKELFLTGEYEQKEIARIVGVTEQTVCRWAKQGNWRVLRSGKHLDLTQLHGIALRMENINDREYLFNLYKKLGGL